MLALLTEVKDRRAGLIGLFTARVGAYFDEEEGLACGVPQPVPPGRPVSHGHDRRARIRSLPGDLLRHELFMTMTEAAPDTLVEIVDEVFPPLATNFSR